MLKHAHADRVARRLCCIRWSNALLGRANLAAAACGIPPLLEDAIDTLVEVKEEVSTIGEEDAAIPIDAPCIQLSRLLEERLEVDDGAITQQVSRVGVDDATGEEVEGVLLVAHHNRVARVCTAIEACDDRVAGKEAEMRVREVERAMRQMGTAQTASGLVTQPCTHFFASTSASFPLPSSPHCEPRIAHTCDVTPAARALAARTPCAGKEEGRERWAWLEREDKEWELTKARGGLHHSKILSPSPRLWYPVVVGWSPHRPVTAYPRGSARLEAGGG